jgi:hypothetical protein
VALALAKTEAPKETVYVEYDSDWTYEPKKQEKPKESVYVEYDSDWKYEPKKSKEPKANYYKSAGHYENKHAPPPSSYYKETHHSYANNNHNKASSSHSSDSGGSNWFGFAVLGALFIAIVVFYQSCKGEGARPRVF